MPSLAAKLQQLAEAERDVRIASSHLRRQRELIEDLERRGEESDKAFELLLQIQEALQVRTERRDRLRGRMNPLDAARVVEHPGHDRSPQEPLVGRI